MKGKEVNIITHGGFEIRQMHEAEREAFMAALLNRVLELHRKHRKEQNHGS